ncbi:hypothetical protein [Chloroflexus sp.]|uniref:hypothetical protein n=1 Tax=Chloroflexus sp. TaxID=1904827 RepID=UPI002ACDB655|nr:hypothetical protein [Chloroflexus sp.]
MPKRIKNPYLQAVRYAKFGGIPRIDASASRAEIHELIDRHMLARDRLVAKYAWAIPNRKALCALAAAAPLVEIGAGNGYWAFLLRQMGVDILAYDANPPLGEGHTNEYSRNSLVVGQVWTDVLPGGPEQAALHADRALFLCWPPSYDPMGYDALSAYRQAGGRLLAYVGDFTPACGDEAFREALREQWMMIGAITIPRWYAMKDSLTFWQPRED